MCGKSLSVLLMNAKIEKKQNIFKSSMVSVYSFYFLVIWSKCQFTQHGGCKHYIQFLLLTQVTDGNIYSIKQGIRSFLFSFFLLHKHIYKLSDDWTKRLYCGSVTINNNFRFMMWILCSTIQHNGKWELLMKGFYDCMS